MVVFLRILRASQSVLCGMVLFDWSLDTKSYPCFGTMQVYNALGFSYFSDTKLDAAINQYEKAVKLQPGYVTAWNNLGNAYELKKEFKKALKAYEEALQFDPSNKIAQRQRDFMKERVNRFQGIPSKD